MRPRLYSHAARCFSNTTKANTHDFKVAVVTGSTSGIGLGIARRLSQDGYSVMINGRRPETKDIADELHSSLAENKSVHRRQEILYHQADMNKEEQIQDLIDYTLSSFGQIDVLVNNAGYNYLSLIHEFPTKQWNDIINIDLNASFYTIRAALPHMLSNGSGRIVNISSIQGLIASPTKSAYVAAKTGLVGLTRAVALEVATKNITCNCICPGFVDTPLIRGQFARIAKERNVSEEQVVNDIVFSFQPTKRFVHVDEIAAAVAFLCSHDARSINGAIIPIDGGAVAQ